MSPRRVLVVASYDSFLKAGICLARRFGEQGAELTIRVLRSRAGQLSDAQLHDLGLHVAPTFCALSDLVTRAELEQFDLVIVSLAGRPTATFIRRFAGLWGGASRRPLLVALYPGLVFRFHYEGMSWRMGADRVLLNSPHDYEMYRALYAASGQVECNGMTAGLALLPGQRRAPRAMSAAAKLLFVGQPTVPASREGRAYLLRSLVEFARRNPDTQVLVKPRHRPGEMTLHRTRYHLSTLLKYAGPVPSNFELTYQPLDELWHDITLCVSVSSTAVLEAIWRGIPARVVTDLGIHENLGNHFFLGSGLLASLSTLESRAPFVLDEAWASRHMAGIDEHFDDLATWLERRLDEQRARGAALPLPGFGEFAFATRTRSEAGGSAARLFADSTYHATRLFNWARHVARSGR